MLSSCSGAHAQIKKIWRIAVIDTGFNKTTSSKVKLCADGHKDFTGFEWDNDAYGHGTHVTNTLANNLTIDNYCIIIIKYTHNPDLENKTFLPLDRTIAAFQYLNTIDVDVVNYSAGGAFFIKEEKKALLALKKRGVSIFVAAGNEYMNLNKKCDFYPPCYKLGIHVIGNLKSDGKRNPSSNYGRIVNHWEMGTGIMAEVSERVYMRLTGTSQASPVALAHWLNRKEK